MEVRQPRLQDGPTLLLEEGAEPGENAPGFRRELLQADQLLGPEPHLDAGDVAPLFISSAATLN